MKLVYNGDIQPWRSAHDAGEKTMLRLLNDAYSYSTSYIAMAVVQDALIALCKNVCETVTAELDGWNVVGPGTPCGVTLETYRAGESGTTLSACVIRNIDEEPEWIDIKTGVTTVTHSTYVPPTHWRWPPAKWCAYCERDEGELHRDNCSRPKLDVWAMRF